MMTVQEMIDLGDGAVDAITAAFKNPDVDRRVKTDWRQLGTIRIQQFRVRIREHDPDELRIEDVSGKKVGSISAVELVPLTTNNRNTFRNQTLTYPLANGGEYHCDRAGLRHAVLQHLRPARENLGNMLKRHGHNGNNAEVVLAYLLEYEVVSWEDLEKSTEATASMFQGVWDALRAKHGV